MKKENTFEDFLSGMDWEMLKGQRDLIKQVRWFRVRSKTRKAVLQRILNLIELWFAYQNRHVNEFKNLFLSNRSTVNWKQLKADKLEYLYIQQLKRLTPEQHDAMEGILNGIDAFQDAAVDELHLDKHEVFTLTKD